MTKSNKIIFLITSVILIISFGFFTMFESSHKNTTINEIRYDETSSANDDDHEDNEEDHNEEEKIISINGIERASQNITSMIVDLRSLEKEIFVPGEVTLDLYNSSLITPRISGQVIKRHVFLGDQVVKGQPLVTLSSVEMAIAQGDLIITDQEWKRVSQLGSDVVSGRRFTEAQVAAQQAFATVEAYGMSKNQISTLLNDGDVSKATGSFTLIAEQDGTIVSEGLVLGEFVEAGHELFTISDETKAWVNASLRADQGAHIEIGTNAKINVDDLHVLEGSLIQVHHSLNEETRTLPVRIAVENEGDELHPGQFVEVSIVIDKTIPKLAVPSDAVILMEGEPNVFILKGDNAIPKPVDIGETYSGWIEIIHGLEVGDKIAVGNIFYIKSLILKSEMGEGHGH